MKALFMAVFILIAGPLKAVEPVSIIPWLPESGYELTNSTVSFSSSTVTTIAAVSGYRKIKIRDITEGTSFFYRLDGSTQSITTAGFLNKATEICEIESNAAIYVQLAAGVASKVFNLLTIRK